MRKMGLKSAKERLRRAHAAVKELESATSCDARETAWSHFLLAANAVYSKLDEAARGCGKCTAWMGRKKHVRKTDELLRFIHQARNIDDHGITGTVLHSADFAIIKGPIYSIKPEIIGDRQIRYTILGGLGSVVERTDYLSLHNVTDGRHGDTFTPPENHLGAPIRPGAKPGDLTRALDVAKLGVAYFDTLVAEAATLPEHF